MDLDNRVEMCMLLDFYGGLLTSKQQNIMHKYYEQDISLVEIGAEEGVSRQAVRDALKTSEIVMEKTARGKILKSYEESLGFVKRHNVLKESLSDIISNIDNISNQELVARLNQLSKDL